MATPPSVPEFSGKKFHDAPWLGQFWQLLQPFFQGLAEPLRGRLTIAENMAGDVLAVSLVIDSAGAVQADAVALKGGITPRAVLVGGAREASGAPVVAPSIAWEVVTANGVPALKVTAATGLAPGKRYVLMLAAFAG